MEKIHRQTEHLRVLYPSLIHARNLMASLEIGESQRPMLINRILPPFLLP